ncbi:hypothetical protein [Streptomyces sp. GbtcB7]|uniref:hypothetical protein n=1 Tax=Streptomyces sp. GbtcB7 TaxID=2824752 RepID=UPI001C3100F1|nr:hypothetical protein [Streptomyces sp. GbtcB7]
MSTVSYRRVPAAMIAALLRAGVAPPSKVDKAMRQASGRPPSTARRYADLAPSILPPGT